MNPDIQTLLNEIFSVAPELREKEPDVRRAVEELLASRPGAEIDAAFMGQLRTRLLAGFAAVAPAKIKPDRPFSPRSFGFDLSFPVSRLGLAGGAVLGLVIVAAVGFANFRPSSPAGEAQDAVVAMVGEVRGVEPGAFGSLVSGAPSAATPEAAATRDGGGRDLAAATGAPVPTVALGLGGGASGTNATRMVIAPDYQPTRHEYRYAGTIPMPKGDVSVLKPERSLDVAAVLGRLAGLNLGLVDLTKFVATQMQSFTLIEDREFGYSVSVNPTDGTAFISKNWQRWPQGNAAPAPLTAGEMSDDNELVAIAQVFLQDYGVDLSAYGEPQVDHRWQLDVARARAAGTEYWLPDAAVVRYPTVVRGQMVLDDSGQPSGLNVTIDLRLKKVTDAGPITAQNYLASAYDAVDDREAVQDAVAAGGLNRWSPEGASVVTHDLGEPQQAYLATWVYRDGRGEQLLVPALMFKVQDYEKQALSGEWVQEYVIIPLAKELYDAQSRPVPMPYLLKPEPAATEGSISPAVTPPPDAVAPAPPPSADLPAPPVTAQ